MFQKFQNADAREEFLEDRFKETRRAAVESFHTQATDVRVRTQQEREQVAAEIDNITNEAIGRRGAAAAAASTAGVSGQSVADVQLDITRARGRHPRQTEHPPGLPGGRGRAPHSVLQQQTVNRVRGAIPSPVVRPNLLGEILRGRRGRVLRVQPRGRPVRWPSVTLPTWGSASATRATRYPGRARWPRDASTP